MVNRGEEKVWVQMNVVPRSTGNTNSGTRELTLKCKLRWPNTVSKCLCLIRHNFKTIYALVPVFCKSQG